MSNSEHIINSINEGSYQLISGFAFITSNPKDYNIQVLYNNSASTYETNYGSCMDKDKTTAFHVIFEGEDSTSKIINKFFRVFCTDKTKYSVACSAPQ